MAGYVLALFFRMALFCDLSGFGAVAGAFSSLKGACCLLDCCLGVVSVLLLTVGDTVMDDCEGGLGGSGGGAEISFV